MIPKKIALSMLAMLLSSCSDSLIDDTALPENKNPIVISVGDSWGYRHLVINQGMRAFNGQPDTVIGFEFLKAIKDTVIYETRFVILEGSYRENLPDSIRHFPLRYALHSDSSGVLSIELIKSSGSLGGVLARTAEVGALNDSLLKLPSVKSFYSMTTCLRFPLRKDSIYTYRNDTVLGNVSISRKYLGQESITLRTGSVMTWKVATVPPIYFPEGMTFTQWYGNHGLLRFQLGPTSEQLTDSLGNKHTIVSSQSGEYIRSSNISDDSLAFLR